MAKVDKTTRLLAEVSESDVLLANFIWKSSLIRCACSLSMCGVCVQLSVLCVQLCAQLSVLHMCTAVCRDIL